MPDVATPGAPDASHLSRRERREIVVVDVPLGVLRVERVDHLGHPEHPEGGHVQYLGLAALEQSRAMGPGNEADLAGDGTDLVGLPAIEADAVFDDPLAHGPSL